MTCTEARDAMLVAEPRDLNPAGESELAGHLRDCDACAAAARHLRSGLDALRAEVKRAHTRRIRRVAAATALPIAAGIIAAVVVRARNRAPGADAPHPAGVVSVQVAPGQQATVFTTKDPKVTVVWLTSGGGAP